MTAFQRPTYRSRSRKSIQHVLHTLGKDWSIRPSLPPQGAFPFLVSPAFYQPNGSVDIDRSQNECASAARDRKDRSPHPLVTSQAYRHEPKTATMAPSASVRARSSAEMAPQPISDDAPAPVKENGLAALAAINAAAAATVPKPPEPELQPDGRYKLTEEAGYKHTAFAFPTWKKWAVLTTIFIVQLSMNWNAAIYGNAIPGLKEDFGVSDGLVRIGQMVFLVAYAFGCELWAPWSEELGRKWVLQGSLFLVNVWQVACALSPSFASIILFRGLGGLSSAGGSVTLGMVWNLLRHGWMSHPASSFVCPHRRYQCRDTDECLGCRHVGATRASICRCVSLTPFQQRKGLWAPLRVAPSYSIRHYILEILTPR